MVTVFRFVQAKIQNYQIPGSPNMPRRRAGPDLRKLQNEPATVVPEFHGRTAQVLPSTPLCRLQVKIEFLYLTIEIP